MIPQKSLSCTPGHILGQQSRVVSHLQYEEPLILLTTLNTSGKGEVDGGKTP